MVGENNIRKTNSIVLKLPLVKVVVTHNMLMYLVVSYTLLKKKENKLYKKHIALQKTNKQTKTSEHILFPV